MKPIFLIFLFILPFQLESSAQLREFDYSPNEIVEDFHPPDGIKTLRVKYIKSKESFFDYTYYFSEDGTIVKCILNSANQSYSQYDIAFNNLYNYSSFVDSILKISLVYSIDSNNVIMAIYKIWNTNAYRIDYSFEGNKLVKKDINGGVGNVSYSYTYHYDSCNRLDLITYNDNNYNFSYACDKYIYTNNNTSISINYSPNSEIYDYCQKSYDSNNRLLQIVTGSSDSSLIIKSIYLYDNERLWKIVDYYGNKRKVRLDGYSIVKYDALGNMNSIVKYNKRKLIINETNFEYSFFE